MKKDNSRPCGDTLPHSAIMIWKQLLLHTTADVCVCAGGKEQQQKPFALLVAIRWMVHVCLSIYLHCSLFHLEPILLPVVGIFE